MTSVRPRRITRRQCCGGLTGALGVAFLAACSPGAASPRRHRAGDGVPSTLLIGSLWPGGAADLLHDAAVLLDPAGMVVAAGAGASLDVPAGVRRLGGPGHWIGPGIIDAHVHLAFGSPGAELRGGLVGVRDLGAPLRDALAWQTRSRLPAGSPAVAVAGPLLTAPGGYPSRSWGAGGFAEFVDSPGAARRIVEGLARDGVDLVKVALEPGAGPVPSELELRAIVDTAHAAGLAVTAHALTRDMVTLALTAGVDELAHTPTQVLHPADVERIAAAGVAIVSTIETFSGGNDTAAVVTNARALVAAGVPLIYGTDLGNSGTIAGVDPRELGRLADAGLGALGALRAATEGSGNAAGMAAGRGRIAVGAAADLVLLAADPLRDPAAWARPVAVVAAGALTVL